MSIIHDDKTPAQRDTNICDDQRVYLTNGQGCNTIWFKTMPAARKAYNKDGIMTGDKLFNCKKCACHYSITKPEFKKYPMHACCKVKKKYAAAFEV